MTFAIMCPSKGDTTYYEPLTLPCVLRDHRSTFAAFRRSGCVKLVWKRPGLCHARHGMLKAADADVVTTIARAW